MSDHGCKRVEPVGASTIRSDDAIRHAIETAARAPRSLP